MNEIIKRPTSDIIWLHRQSIHNDLGKLTLKSGTLEIVNWEDEKDTRPETVGHFEILEGQPLGFYRIEHVLFLLLGQCTVYWSDDIQIELSFKRDERYLRIKQEDTVLASYDYSLDRTQIFADDPTPFIKDEDFDFGLFLLNIANDPGRKLRLSGHICKG